MLTHTPFDSLQDRLASVKQRIAQAARRSGRDPAEVTLVAVTKTLPVDAIVQAYALGLRDFGENRVEEAQDKLPAVQACLPSPAAPPRFHMIGHVQSRKARDVAALFDIVHSVDSLKLAGKLSRALAAGPRALPILLECNVSGEASKYGFQPYAAGFWADVEALLALPGLQLEGLMTMAPVVDEPEQARPVFAALRRLGQALAARFGAACAQQLSMGMTDDFEVAIEEGATMVRVGRALFGETPPTRLR